MSKKQDIHHTEDLSKYRFLVTGGAGFIGSNMVAYLLRNGVGKVIVFDNLSTGNMDNIIQYKRLSNFEFVRGDIRDYNTVCENVMHVDYVIHLAALGSVPRSLDDPITSNDVNVSGFLNVLHAAKEANVKKMIYAASSSTYGDSEVFPRVEDHIGTPLSPYAVTKYINELYADNYSRNFNFHTVGLRYFNVFGPNQSPNDAYSAVIPKFISAALANRNVTIYGDGNQTRDFTYIENVIQANIKAVFSLRNEHEIYNVGVGEQISVNKLWESIKKITNSKSEVLYENQRKADVKHSLADVNKAKKHLDYVPEYSVQKGLSHTYEWFSQKRLILKG